MSIFFAVVASTKITLSDIPAPIDRQTSPAGNADGQTTSLTRQPPARIPRIASYNTDIWVVACNNSIRSAPHDKSHHSAPTRHTACTTSPTASGSPRPDKRLQAPGFTPPLIILASLRQPEGEAKRFDLVVRSTGPLPPAFLPRWRSIILSLPTMTASRGNNLSRIRHRRGRAKVTRPIAGPCLLAYYFAAQRRRERRPTIIRAPRQPRRVFFRRGTTISTSLSPRTNDALLSQLHRPKRLRQHIKSRTAPTCRWLIYYKTLDYYPGQKRSQLCLISRGPAGGQ